MSERTEAAERVAEAAGDAYMASSYGHPAFVRMARLLLDEGLTEHEAESILKSKHPRWADDSEGHGNGKGTNSAAFRRYFDAHKARGLDWKEEGREMALGTPSNLPEHEANEDDDFRILKEVKTPISKIQEIMIQLLRLSTFEELNGDYVADDLIAHRDLWVSFLIDREPYVEFAWRQDIYREGLKEGQLPPSLIDTIRLRDLSSNYWNVDALFIVPVPGKEDALELLVRRSWNADEIDWYDPGQAKHIDGLEISKMLRVWWD